MGMLSLLAPPRRAAAGLAAAASVLLAATAAPPAGGTARPGPAAAYAATAHPAATRPAAVSPATTRPAAPRLARAAPSAGAQIRMAEQAQLAEVDAPAAWRVSRGRGVTVGVLDTGVDASAPDLTGSVVTGPDYTLGADPAGYQPPHLHGTFIASIIAGHGSGPGQAGGVVGVAPAARVLSVRVILDDQEPGLGDYDQNPAFASAIGRGVRYATMHGAGVINMSLGTDHPTRELQSAIAFAVSHGVVVVASAGNDGVPDQPYTPYSYPASYTGVISVAALGTGGGSAFFSDRNSSVVISAPGVNIVGAGPDGSYLQASGTSPASAFVAGVAALIRSAYPALSPAQVTQALTSSAGHRPAAGYSPEIGFGELDAAAALRAAGRLAAVRPTPGLTAWRHFASGAPGPIQVVHRDQLRLSLLAGLGGLAALGFLACLVTVGVLIRRATRGGHGSVRIS